MNRRISQDCSEKEIKEYLSGRQEDLEMNNQQNLRTYFAEDWRRQLFDSGLIFEVIEKVRDDYELTGTLSKYEINDDRIVVIGTVRHTQDGSLRKLIVDVISGEPTWQQMMDLAFSFGGERDIGIVVFDGGKRPELDPRADRDLVKSFAKILNECGRETYVVQATPSHEIGEKGLRPCLVYSAIEKPLKGMSDVHPELPSKKEFERVEFWKIFYDSKDVLCNVGFARDPDSWFKYYGSLANDELFWTCEWDDCGVFLRLRDTTSTNDLQWLWENKREKIMKDYGEYEINVHESNGRLFELSIKVLEAPFRNFALWSLEEKLEYTDIIVAHNYWFGDFCDSLIKEMRSDRKAANS